MVMLASPQEVVRYKEVFVADTVILEREPDTVVTVIERIRTVEVPALQIATATDGAVAEIAAFCLPPDTVYVERQERSLVRSVVLDPAPWYSPMAKDKLFISAVTSGGDLTAYDFTVRPGWSMRAGNGVNVRQDRFAIVGDLVITGALIYTAVDLIGTLAR